MRGGHLSSRAPWVNNVSLRHHLAKNKVEYKKTRWNIDHRKLSYLHIPTSIWVPCAFRNVLSYGARFCVLQGKRNIHLICLGRRISPKMNVVGWEMIIMSEVRLYNGGGCSAEFHRRRKIICPRDRLVPQGSSFPLYVISHLSSNWKQQTSNNSPPTTCRPYHCSSRAWDIQEWKLFSWCGAVGHSMHCWVNCFIQQKHSSAQRSHIYNELNCLLKCI